MGFMGFTVFMVSTVSVVSVVSVVPVVSLVSMVSIVPMVPGYGYLRKIINKEVQRFRGSQVQKCSCVRRQSKKQRKDGI